MTDIKPTSTCTTVEIHPSSVRFMQSSSSSLHTLNTLPTDRFIVLFTPAIPSTDSQEDPFECFGRSLSKWHSRIRHVPFVAKVGLTDLHVAWIRKAGEQHALSSQVRHPSREHTARCSWRVASAAIRCLYQPLLCIANKH